MLAGERRLDDNRFADDVVREDESDRVLRAQDTGREGVLMDTTPTGCSPRRAATPAWMTVPDAPVSIIAAIETGLGTGCPLETRIASTAWGTAIRTSTIGPIDCRLGTATVNDGT